MPRPRFNRVMESMKYTMSSEARRIRHNSSMTRKYVRRGLPWAAAIYRSADTAADPRFQHNDWTAPMSKWSFSLMPDISKTTGLPGVMCSEVGSENMSQYMPSGPNALSASKTSRTRASYSTVSSYVSVAFRNNSGRL